MNQILYLLPDTGFPAIIIEDDQGINATANPALFFAQATYDGSDDEAAVRWQCRCQSEQDYPREGAA